MAYAEICGSLEKTIIIHESQHSRKYGVIFITVDQKRGAESNFWRGIYKSNCMPVFVWGQDVLNKLEYISDDEKVWLVARLESLDNLLLKEVGHYIKLSDLQESGNIVISIRDKSRIRTIGKNLVHTSWLSISGY